MVTTSNAKNIHTHFTPETKMVSGVQELKLIFCRSLPVLLPFIISLFFLYKWLYKKPISKMRLLPCPPRLPILGNLHQFGTLPHRSLRSLSEKYGDLMLIYSGTSPILIVSSAKAACEIMKTNDVIFSDRLITKTVNKLLYNSKDVAAAKYGEYWRQMKSICVLHLLSTKRVRSFRSVREEEMVLMMEKIENSMSLSVNLNEILMSFTNDVTCRVALGRKYGGKEGGNDFTKMLSEILEALGAFRVGDFIPWLGWTNWISGWDAKVDRIAKEFDCFLEEVVREHEDRPLRVVDGKGKDEDRLDNENVNDIVDVLLEVQKDETVGFRIDRDSIKALILDMFLAGTDTTYSALEWGMTELLRHPTVLHELQKEVREITKEKQYVSEDDIEKMKYLKAVIKETLRLHPPVPLLVPRLSTQEAKIYGYDIPEKTGVIINACAIHRDPAFWDEPEKFNPGRFVNSQTDFRGQDFQLIPFGGGRRICPGISFAIANIELALANLVNKFNWTLPGGAKPESLDTDECPGLSIHRKTPLVAVAIPHTC